MRYFLTIAFSFFSIILLAQSGTTLDEYRYLSKGYAYQIEMGLDPTKNGYEIRKNYLDKNGTSIIGLYQANQKMPKGLLMVTTDASGKSYYRALPNPAAGANVLALYQQDQSQHLPKTARDKMEAAKNHYLFSMPGDQPSEYIAQIKEETAPIKTKYAEPKTTDRPTVYETLPDHSNDQLTAKGGTAVLSPKKVDRPASSNTNSSGSTKKVNTSSGTTVTGQLNAELNNRTLLILPNTENTTPASGRVVIKFCTNAQGAVTYAKFTQKGSTTFNSQLKALALAAVQKMRLASSEKEEDCGTVGFDF